MKKFTVYITRTEAHRHEVDVEAESREDAERIVREMDERNAFEDVWNEGFPSVTTRYTGEVSA